MAQTTTQPVRADVRRIRARWIDVTLLGKWSAWLLLAASLIGIAMLMDDFFARLLTAAPHTEWRVLANWLSRTGEWYFVGAVGAAGTLALLAQCRFQAARNVLFVTLTGLGTGFSGTFLRCLVGRARPEASVAPGFYGIWHNSHLIFGQHQFGSFPSGHVSTVAGIAAAAWLLNRRAGFWAGLFMVLVAWSRIAQSAHHFSDLVAGCLWGIAGALWMRARIKPLFIPAFNHLSKSWIHRIKASRAPRENLHKRPVVGPLGIADAKNPGA